MSDVSGILFDKDATYIDIPDKHIVFSKPSMLFPSGVSAADMTEEQQIQKARETVMDAQSGHTAAFSEGVALVQTLQDTQQAVDAQLNNSTMQLFAGGRALTSAEFAAAQRSGDGEEGDDSEQEESEDGYSGESDDMEAGDSDDVEDGESEDEEEEEEKGSDGNESRTSRPAEMAVEHSGRLRRRAVFDDGNDDADGLGQGASGDSSDDEDEDDEESEDEAGAGEQASRAGKKAGRGGEVGGGGSGKTAPRKHSDEAKAGKQEYNKRKKGIKAPEVPVHERVCSCCADWVCNPCSVLVAMVLCQYCTLTLAETVFFFAFPASSRAFLFVLRFPVRLCASLVLVAALPASPPFRCWPLAVWSRVRLLFHPLSLIS